MTDALARRSGALSPQPGSAGNLADILERVLDKGVVIAGDIKINLLDIELLTIKLRLLVVSVDTAREMGIDWWEHDPTLSAGGSVGSAHAGTRATGVAAVPWAKGDGTRSGCTATAQHFSAGWR